MKILLSSLRIALLTLLVSSGGYTLAIWGFAQAVRPDTANGGLIRNAEGMVIGSRLIAQSFTSPRHFWPRPSAVDYNAAWAGGSNLSPTSPKLTERAQGLIAAHGGVGDLPADLVAASGGGLDPHISLEGARRQAKRVALARGQTEEAVLRLVESLAFPAGGLLAPGKIVNVLELNLALNARD